MADIEWGPCAIGYLDRPTSDGRVVESAGYTSRTLPLPMDWQELTDEGHDRAITVGRVDSVSIDPATGKVMASGVWLDPEIIPAAARARYLTEQRVVYPSMQPAACEAEIRYTGGGEGYYAEDGYQEPEPLTEMCVFTKFQFAKVTLVAVQAFDDLWITANGEDPQMPMLSVTASGVRSSGWSDMPVAGADVEWNSDDALINVAEWSGIGGEGADTSSWEQYARAFLYQDPDADPQTRGAYKLPVADVVDGELTLIPRGVYAVAGVLSGARGGADIPEEQQDKLRGVVRAMYEHIASALDDDTIEAPFTAVTACAAVNRPPAEFFQDPKLTGPTPITITEPNADGWRRIYGHMGQHDVPHRGLPGNFRIPRSMSGYREFLLGLTMTADGKGVPTGKVTIGGGHADDRFGQQPSRDHYDDVSTTIANVAAGDDDYGVWISGAIVADATVEQVDQLLQSPPSGDWRTDVLGNLEMIGVHSVNSPGYPVYRIGLDDKGGYSLVASSALVGRRQEVPDAAQHDDAYVAKLAAALKVELDWTRSSQPTAFAFVSTPEGFDPAAEDLRAEFTRHGLSWPTLVGEMNGVPAAPFEIAEGCVRGWLAANAPVELAIEPVPAPDNGDALRRAQAKLAALRLDRVKGR